MKRRSGLYFTADLQLSCENLFKRFIELLLQIKDRNYRAEWLDLSNPMMTHKIVLPWYGKTFTHTTLKLLRVRDQGQSRARVHTRHVIKQLETLLPTVNQPPGPADSQNLKMKAFPEVSFKRPLVFIRTVTLLLSVFASEAQPLETSLNYQALITVVVLGFSWTNTRAESKIGPTQSWYPWHSEDNHKLSAILKHLMCTQLHSTLIIPDTKTERKPEGDITWG